MDLARQFSIPVRRVVNTIRRNPSTVTGSPDTSKPQRRAFKNSFPFGELPQEIRSEIISFAILSVGSYSATKRWGVSKEIRRRQRGFALDEHAMFVNICLVNRWMLSEARALLHREVCYDIVEYLHPPRGRRYHPHLGPHFHSMQCYHIKFQCTMSGTARERPYSTAVVRHMVRAYLEMFAYTLEAKMGIRRMKLTLPCLQTLPKSKFNISDEFKNVDFLSPLKHLRVAEPVLFEIVDNTGLPTNPTACACPNCRDLLQHICAKFTRLQGEKLNAREQTWQRIRCLIGKDRIDDEINDRFRKLHAQLYDRWGRDVASSSFDDLAIETENFIREKHRQWRQQRSTYMGRMLYGIDKKVENWAWEFKASTRRR